MGKLSSFPEYTKLYFFPTYGYFIIASIGRYNRHDLTRHKIQLKFLNSYCNSEFKLRTEI